MHLSNIKAYAHCSSSRIPPSHNLPMTARGREGLSYPINTSFHVLTTLLHPSSPPFILTTQCSIDIQPSPGSTTSFQTLYTTLSLADNGLSIYMFVLEFSVQFPVAENSLYESKYFFLSNSFPCVYFDDVYI